MINKNKFSIKNTKKVLHKVGKKWVVVSAVLLGLAAGGAAVTTVNADSTNASANQANVVSAAPSSAAAKPASASASTASVSSVRVAPMYTMRLGATDNVSNTFTKDLINTYISKVANLNGNSKIDYQNAMSDAVNALENNNNVSGFWSSLSANAGSFLSEHPTLKTVFSNAVTNANNDGLEKIYSDVQSNPETRASAEDALNNLKSVAGNSLDANGTNNTVASLVDNIQNDVSNAVANNTSLQGDAGVTPMANAMSNNASSYSSSASSESQPAPSQNTDIPYVAPDLTSAASSNASTSSSSAVAQQSASANTSVISKVTKRNHHKVAGHYVNVPNKHIALMGVNRHAKFYVGKKAVKFSPKALKHAKVVEAVRKGHHVTYLVQVGKHAYTVRGYVKDVKPAFANAKRVTVRIGRRTYRINTKRVRVVKAVRRGANVTYTVKVNRKYGIIYAKVTKRIFVRRPARRTNIRRNHARKYVSPSYYNSMKREHYVRANRNIWVHSRKNFTKRNAKFELRRGTVVYTKRLVRAKGSVARFAVRGGFISARKSDVRLFK